MAGEAVRSGPEWWGRERRRRGVRLAVLTFGVTVSSTVFVGVASLILEDWLPNTSLGTTTPGRGITATVAFAVLLGTVWGVRAWRRRGGTLFYVRLLHPWMADWHGYTPGPGGGFSDVVALPHWLPPPSSSTVAGLVAYDVAEPVAELSSALRDAMSGDDINSGYHLQPNLLWPTGIALGWDLFAWPGLSLDEANPRPELAYQWPWDDAAGSMEDARVAVDRILKLPTPDAPLRLVHLCVRATGHLPTPPPWAADLRVDVAVEGGWIHPADAEAVHPAAVTRRVSRELRSLLHDHPRALIVVTMQVPKTVSVAVGWDLANLAVGWSPVNVQPAQPRTDPGCGHDGCDQPSCRYPLSRLVLLDWDHGRQAYAVMRAHATQPSLEELDALIGVPQPVAAGSGAGSAVEATAIVNLTPHDVTVYGPEGPVLVLPAEPVSARVAQVATPGARVGVEDVTVPVSHIRYGGITGLPAPQPGTSYLVSRVVAEHSDRPDLYFPEDEVRDEQKRIAGCRTFGRFGSAGSADA